MITVIRLGPAGELVAVAHCASLPDGVAVAAAYPRPGTSFLVEGRVVVWLGPNGDDCSWRLHEATGCAIIRLDDALNGARELYRMATRPIALEKLLQTLERWRLGEVEELPMISCRGVKL